MEMIKNEKIYAFDSLYTTNHIQMLKILLPCLSPPLQKNLALFIKFLELRYTISFLSTHPYVIKGCGFDKAPTDWQLLSNDLLPYLTPKEAESFKQLKKSMDMMKQFSSMQKNLEALKDILPEGMDLESIFQGMMGGSDKEPGDKEASPGQEGSGGQEQKNTDSILQTGELLKAMMGQNDTSSPENVMKKMMSSSQMDIYEKFNERFKDL